MALPISVDNVLKIFELATGRRATERACMIEWLDAVYSDLEELSVLWMKIMGDVESAQAQESKDALEILYSRGFRDNLHLQKRIWGRLLEFYRSATEVLSGTTPGRPLPEKYRDHFIFDLGSILAARLKARQLIPEEYGMWMYLADRAVTMSMREAYDKLQDEIAGLQVLIKNIKAIA